MFEKLIDIVANGLFGNLSYDVAKRLFGSTNQQEVKETSDATGKNSEVQIDRESVDRELMSGRPAIAAPEGVAFHPFTIRVPLIPGYFQGPLWYAGLCRSGEVPVWLCQFGDWVKAGTPICRFYVNSKPSSLFPSPPPIVLNIVAPSNGLVISNGSFTFDSEGGGDYLFAMVPARPIQSNKNAASAFEPFAVGVRDSVERFLKWEIDFDQEKMDRVLNEMLKGKLVQLPLSNYINEIDQLWKASVRGDVIQQLRNLVE